jgi:hypothetical protein
MGGAVLANSGTQPGVPWDLLASWPQAAVPMGNLLATGMLFLLLEQFLGWKLAGWRRLWLSVSSSPVSYHRKSERCPDLLRATRGRGGNEGGPGRPC